MHQKRNDMKKNKILLLFAHPSSHRSEVNTPLFELAQSLGFVTSVDLYAEYPDRNIDIEAEQERLNDHDVIIFQFPLYWYSTPPILKEWQDLVLEYGYAYGKGGDALKDKKFICAVSAGGSESAYHSTGSNFATLRDYLKPLEQTANVTGMEYIPPFAIFSSRNPDIRNQLPMHFKQWRTLLYLLHSNKLYRKNYQDEITINSYLQILTTDALGS